MSDERLTDEQVRDYASEDGPAYVHMRHVSMMARELIKRRARGAELEKKNARLRKAVCVFMRAWTDNEGIWVIEEHTGYHSPSSIHYKLAGLVLECMPQDGEA